jgi:SAM-dependent methyltransferase
MATDYDVIAERYRRAKLQPWRALVESFTLFELIGGLSGLTVVDLACGEGHYTRLLRRQGAERVTGVDLSAGMIALARAEEQANPLEIDYHVHDVRNLDLPEQFDLAVAAYLLNYARSRDELGAMCQAIARTLKPGGRFVTVNSNPALDFNRLPSFAPYGFDISWDGDVREGMPYTWTFHLDDGPLRIENYYLNASSHEQALRAAGFGEVRWHSPRLAPAVEEGDGRDFWGPFLAHAPAIFLECVKSEASPAAS